MNKLGVFGLSIFASASILQVSDISASAAESTTMYVKVKGIDLNVRKTASTTAKIVGTLKNNTKVTVLSQNSGWAKISYKNSTAYVYNTYLTTTKPKATAAAKVTTYYVNTGNISALNVRKSKSTSAKIVGSIKNGKKAEVITFAKDWSKVKYGSSFGYVASKYLTKKNKLAVSETEEILVGNYYATPGLSTNLNVRIEASSTAQKLGEIKQNSLLQVLSQKDGWTKIKFGATYGYVSNDYVSEEISVDFKRDQDKSYTVKDINSNGTVKSFFQQEERKIVKWGNVNDGFTHSETITANSYAMFNYNTGHGFAINEPIFLGATDGTLKDGYSKITSIDYTAKIAAGTFKDVVVQKFYNSKGVNTKVVYYAPNNGVIKATNNGNTIFELISVKN